MASIWPWFDISKDGVGTIRSTITDIGRELYVVGAGGGEPRLLAVNVVSGPSWSPDGQRLAIAQAEVDGVGLYVIGIDGTESRRVDGHRGMGRTRTAGVVWFGRSGGSLD